MSPCGCAIEERSWNRSPYQRLRLDEALGVYAPCFVTRPSLRVEHIAGTRWIVSNNGSVYG